MKKTVGIQRRTRIGRWKGEGGIGLLPLHGELNGGGTNKRNTQIRR